MRKRKISIFSLRTLCTAVALCAAFFVHSQSSRYYWVGKGDGYSWNQIMNWSSTSGGAGGAMGNVLQAPTNNNTVVFDVNSATAEEKMITLSGDVQCDSLIVAKNSPVAGFSAPKKTVLIINGSLLIKKAGMIWDKNQTLRFTSNRTRETIQTSGTVLGSPEGKYEKNFSSAAFIGEIYFTGGGNWMLADDLATNSKVTLEAGTLNTNKKNLSTHTIISKGGKIVFPRSIIHCSYEWDYNHASSPALTKKETEGSLIRIAASGFKGRKDDLYHNLEFTGGMYLHKVSAGQFNKITFLNGSAEIGAGNSMLITTDSLVIRTTNHYDFHSATVRKYLEAKPPVSGGQVRLFSSGWSDKGITMSAGAVVNVERAVIHNLKISGTTATVEESLDWGGAPGWTFASKPKAGRNMYWIGGEGWWNDPAHWSFTSGGKSAGRVPALADNVFFNSKSGIQPGGIVRMNGDAWCNNMTWTKAGKNPFLNLCGVPDESRNDIDYHSDNFLMTGGSMTLQSDLIINTTTSISSSSNAIYFVSDRDAETIVTNNAAAITAHIYFQSVSGAGKWKLKGDLNLVYGGGVAKRTTSRRTIHFNRGGLDVSGQRIVASDFVGAADTKLSGESFKKYHSARSLNMANSVFDLSSNWYYYGGKQLTAVQSAGSLISCGVGNYTPTVLTKANDRYYNVELRTTSKGKIYSENKGETFFNKVTVSAPGVQINSTVTNNGVICPDSLLFTGNGTYTIVQNFTVNKYLSTSAGCGGNTTLTATSAKTITLGKTANQKQTYIRDTRLNNISVTPHPQGGYEVYDCTFDGTTKGWKNTSLPAKTLYWVGGAGNWSDGAHWSTVSGTKGGAYGSKATGCPPRQIDDVIFDDGSFSEAGQSVTIDINAYCHDMRWIGADANLKPELASLNDIHLYISGSLQLQRGMLFKESLPKLQYMYIHFTSGNPKGETITSNGVPLHFSAFSFENPKGKWTFTDDMEIKHPGGVTTESIHFVGGTLDFGGHKVKIDGLKTEPVLKGNSYDRDTRTLIIENSTIELSSSWNYSGNLRAKNSTINHKGIGNIITEAGAPYHNYNWLANPLPEKNHYLQGGSWNRLYFDKDFWIKNAETDTLSLSTNSAYVYQFQDTIRVNKAFYGNGTPCNTIYLQSREKDQPAYLDIRKAAANMPGDTLLVDYAYIHGLHPLTGKDNAHLYKGSHAPDVDKSGKSWGYGKGLSNNNNKAAIGGINSWARMDNFNKDDSSPFGGDKKIACFHFPYLLTSDNFVPTPNARFKWFNCDYATIEKTLQYLKVYQTDAEKFDKLDSWLGKPVSTGPEYRIEGNESGETYSLIVDYGNGCVAYDDITITKIVFPGCEPIETCDDTQVIDLSAALSDVKYDWSPDPNATVDKKQVVTVNRPAAFQSQTVKLLLHIGNGANGAPSDPFTVTVRFTPSAMVWLGNTADWQNAGNWYPEGVPRGCTDVYIPGKSVEENTTYYFPNLTGSRADNVCDRIFFLPGAQLGRPNLLTYNEAHVEIDYGKGSLSKQTTIAYTDFAQAGKKAINSKKRVQLAATYPAVSLERNRWNMLSAPLKGMLTGDFSFGGFPFSFIRKFDADGSGSSYIKGKWADFNKETNLEFQPGQGFGHYYYAYVTGTPYGMDNGANAGQWDRAVAANQLTSAKPLHVDNKSTFGLAQQNGVLHFPYFADKYLSAVRRTHEYNETKDVSIFHFVWQSPLKSNAFLQFTGEKEEVSRTGDAYKFITDGKWDFHYTAGRFGANELVLVGNPYMSALDFEAFYNANRGKIKNAYSVYRRSNDYATYNGDEGEKYIAPMQSFLVETDAGFSGRLSLEFNTEMATTSTETTLRLSQTAADKLTITAGNPDGKTSAVIRRLNDAKDELCNRDISKIIDKADNLPNVYTLVGMNNGKMRALSVNSIQSNHAVIPIGVTSSYKGDVTFTITGMDAYDAEISFVDAMTGTRQDITGQREFTYTYKRDGKKISVEDRFYLYFSNASTGTEDIRVAYLHAYAQQADLIVLSSDDNPVERVAVYDIQGRLISEHKLSGSSPYRIENVLRLPGIYTARVYTNQTTKSIKVIR